MVFCDDSGLPSARPRMSRFRPVDRHTSHLLPPSIEDWLPDNHLARFIVEGLSGFFGMLGGAVSSFITGMSKALGVTPSLLREALIYSSLTTDLGTIS